MNEVYLCLGGNLGTCIETFTKSILLLEEKNITICLKSSIYTSSAWGMCDAPDFYNQAVKIKTSLHAWQLLCVLHDIEKHLGRERNSVERYESRIIDMDILFFNKEVIESESLQIPHPRLHRRIFVLEPMNEIAPEFVHPKLNKTISSLLRECTDTGITRKVLHAF